MTCSWIDSGKFACLLKSLKMIILENDQFDHFGPFGTFFSENFDHCEQCSPQNCFLAKLFAKTVFALEHCSVLINIEHFQETSTKLAIKN